MTYTLEKIVQIKSPGLQVGLPFLKFRAIIHGPDNEELACIETQEYPGLISELKARNLCVNLAEIALEVLKH